MATGLSSDEVAEDYKNSLEDLQMNSRYEISNLTIIAKESIHHALRLSKVIEEHIRLVSDLLFERTCTNWMLSCNRMISFSQSGLIRGRLRSVSVTDVLF